MFNYIMITNKSQKQWTQIFIHLISIFLLSVLQSATGYVIYPSFYLPLTRAYSRNDARAVHASRRSRSHSHTSFARLQSGSSVGKDGRCYAGSWTATHYHSHYSTINNNNKKPWSEWRARVPSSPLLTY